MTRLLVLLFLIVAVLTSTKSIAEDRLALVIGNADYRNVSALANPVNDAQLMERTLRQAGFRVTMVTEADREGMTRAIERFGRQVRKAKPGALAFFYFAGHGVRSDGFNYLVPINVDIRSEADFARETLAAEWVLEQIQVPGVTSVMVLDACRNNPFEDGAGRLPELGDGLARMTASGGNFVAYATGPGDVALDGEGRNSPYTAALARAIQTPDLDVHEIFTQVREQVVAATDGLQVPWETSSLHTAVYIQPGVSDVAPDLPVLRLSVVFSPDVWNVDLKCRRTFRYEPVNLAVARGRSHRIRSTYSDESLEFDLAMNGAELSILPAAPDESGRPVVVKLDRLQKGGRKAFFTSERHPDMFDCGDMVINVRRDS
ncbi:MAG: caspase family protein [Pseudomonadota bacterium]